MKTFYITTPIYYVNDIPHIGHIYTTIAADVMTRYKRFFGKDTYFLTGTDEHGQKIAQAALKNGFSSPKELADSVVGKYYTLWEKLNISNNDFIRTTDERHKKAVQKAFEKLLASGDIYLGEYEGYYCVPCESFWTSNQLGDDKNCPDCGRPTSLTKEPTYFFKMSKYQDLLLEHIEKNPDFIKPAVRKNEVVSFIKQGLKDLSVSRVSFDWGIPVLSDPKHVVYVWIDALLNYVSALGYCQEDDSLLKKYWPANCHLVGKDIIRFHAVYWPTLLMALDLPLFNTVFAHGWWTIEGKKMSKSFNNVINPFDLVDKFGVDPVRYFLLREVTFGNDGDFSYKSLINRINSDLSNDFGNLVSRTLTMVNKYLDGFFPQKSTKEESTPSDIALEKLINKTSEEYIYFMDEFLFNKALISVWDLISFLNKYIDENQPWNLYKDLSKHDRLKYVLYNLCNGIYIAGQLLSPFMPETADKLSLQLIKSKVIIGKGILNFVGEGKVDEIKPLFPRVETLEFDKPEPAKNLDTKTPTKIETTKEQPEISFSDFEKVKIIVAKVISAEKVNKSDKLLKLSIDNGSSIKTIVSGIAQSYSPEEITGKVIAIVDNLKPVKLMGITSFGMVLTAFDGNKHNLITLPDSIPLGTIVK